MLYRLFAIPLGGLLVGAGALAFQRYELHRPLQPHGYERPLAPTIAFLGDSHTANSDWDLLLGCRDTANYGVGGETSAKIMVRLEQVIAAKPRFVIVMAGTNDAIQNVPPETTIANIETIKRELRSAHIPHLVLAPPPLPVRAKTIEEISDAATLKVPFSSDDLAVDGIHLRRSGYVKWRDAIAPIVKDICGN